MGRRGICLDRVGDTVCRRRCAVDSWDSPDIFRSAGSTLRERATGQCRLLSRRCAHVRVSRVELRARRPSRAGLRLPPALGGLSLRPSPGTLLLPCELADRGSHDGLHHPRGPHVGGNLSTFSTFSRARG